MSEDWQQHLLVDPSGLDFLSQLNIAGKSVVEFGGGGGALTIALLERGVAQIEAWEIDPAMSRPSADPRLTWLWRDIELAEPADVQGRAVVSFPPYSLLPFLFTLCADVADLVLMVPEKHIAHCLSMGMTVLADLPGAMFLPPAEGRHVIVARGFGLFSKQ